MSFRIETKTDSNENIPIIIVEGDITYYTAPIMKTHMIALFEANNANIIFDFSRATYLDSTAMGTLIGGLKRSMRMGGTLAIVCTNRDIKRTFEITGLDKIFDIFDTVEDAASSFKAILTDPIIAT